ncbi:MAG: ribbon-helix-helix domain-containing protein [Candidatus Aminicenantes bacterium]|nr:ribbon-helix-helix domain-containing protein [Candidatus Aminicenantes bacterium]
MTMKSDRSESPRGKELLKTNLYRNKEGEVIQKVTVHLPRELVKRLKRVALDRDITLSELIRESLK